MPRCVYVFVCVFRKSEERKISHSREALIFKKIDFCKLIILINWAYLVDQLVKNPPAMLKTWLQSLGWEDPLEKGKAAHSSILAWRAPWAEFMARVHRVTECWTQRSDFHLLQS